MRLTLRALIPKEPQKPPERFGDHIRQRRCQLRISQREAGVVVGVTAQTILHWEKGHTEPPIESMPAILRFLGYEPFPKPETLADRLFCIRRRRGWTIKEAAKALGVDEGTWSTWERGQGVPRGRRRRSLVDFLACTEPPGLLPK